MRGTREPAGGREEQGRIIPRMRGTRSCTASGSPAVPDHPRACGELASRLSRTPSASGSSPRMRGTRGHRECVAHRIRIIPAHAGNSLTRRRSLQASTDHPRACGELVARIASGDLFIGSSPRMRGTPCRGERLYRHRRIIPAHAGNSPRRRYGVGSWSESSPRMRGTPWYTAPGGRRVRIHPRACGELQCLVVDVENADGSSPRMRGTLLSAHGRERRVRIIPAHAGNSWRRAVREAHPADHPRACGELPNEPSSHVHERGSSPRMRGTLVARHEHLAVIRIIPAHAGNSATGGACRPLAPDHPRACGELAMERLQGKLDAGSSPRMRGTPASAGRGADF